MAQPKLAVIYYSATGTVHAMAQRLTAAGEKAGADVRTRQVDELAPPEAIASNPAWAAHVERTKDDPRARAGDVVWADAVLFGSPTRYGNVSSQLKQFLDRLGPQWQQGLLADKVYAGFTASMTAHGGQESTLLALYNTIHHFGGILAAPGYTDPLKYADGNPYGVSHVTGGANNTPLGDPQLAALDHLAERVVRIAAKLNA
ncbi:NAD(P)H-dependent oxidoreductase [Dactylosporangium sp. AC04546]|uniref:flavodoxin family protein n=1 Tax=Dactylosporangium sp. AC04546 TaxID=2862460 RepID=UPI001EDCA637|nr:NAD(P)H-dependent oxidoreductase [Dactylosporangium sp. AC04546]WVK81263.1 NAD(P)H-dependent oxidoreductase [Dactylosporangium sp. AC04546]